MGEALENPKTSHTPGPWIVRGISMEDGSISIGSEEYRIVISYVTNAASLGDFISAAIKGRHDFGAPDTAKSQWANARLISAAPDLLDAVKGLDKALCTGFSTQDGRMAGRKALIAARAAVAKATGEAA